MALGESGNPGDRLNPSFLKVRLPIPTPKQLDKAWWPFYMWNLKTKVMEESINSSSKLAWLAGWLEKITIFLFIIEYNYTSSNDCFFHRHLGFQGCVSLVTQWTYYFFCVSQLEAKVLCFFNHISLNLPPNKRGERRWISF